MTQKPSLAQMCGVMLSGSEEATPSVVYHCVLRGLERLLLSEQLSRLDAESLVKLSVDRVNVHSPHRAMAALGLMLTCMYTGEPGKRVPLGARRRGSAGAFRLRGVRAPSGSRGQSPIWEQRSGRPLCPVSRLGPAGPRPRVRPSVGVP